MMRVCERSYLNNMKLEEDTVCTITLYVADKRRIC